MRRGQALIVAVFVMVACAVLSLLAVQMLSINSYSSIQNLRGFQALHAAEAGVVYTFASSLDSDSNWSNNASIPPIGFPAAVFWVKFKNSSRVSTTLESTGSCEGIQRTVTVVCTKELNNKRIKILFWGEDY
jgi:hypothetical protein